VRWKYALWQKEEKEKSKETLVQEEKKETKT
jgi:hypothetical protein